MASRSIREFIQKHFDDAELRILCTDLHVDYAGLGGAGEQGKALALVDYCEQHTSRFQPAFTYLSRAFQCSALGQEEDIMAFYPPGARITGQRTRRRT